MPKSSIYLFNRDLRWQDNECLATAIKNSEIVYPIFILTPEQIDRNPYANWRSVSFMCSSLIELAQDIPLCVFSGMTKAILRELCVQKHIDTIYNNIDVSPYAIKRTEQIKQLCKELQIQFVQGHDIFYGRHANLLKTNNKPYVKYTPFYQNAKNILAREQPIKRISLNTLKKIKENQGLDLLKKHIKKDEYAAFIPGRKAAISQLRKYKADTKEQIPLNNTSHMSAYLHFGILGPIELMNLLKPNKKSAYMHRQLIWREFYLYIVWYIHTDYTKKSRTIPQRNKKIWTYNAEKFKRWCLGNTGCPWVDAGMRELNKTGFMHNRLRMNVAMFLIFYLQIDWKLGERYFAQNLYDYDYCQNLCNWMWCASWERFSNPDFRVFSMVNQAKTFDPDATYIKKWIPELNKIPAKDLFNWSQNYKKYPTIKYPKPIIMDLDKARYNAVHM